jgi:hypothetical protein
MSNFNQQQKFADYTVLESKQVVTGAISKKFMATVFLWMFIALGVSATFAILFSEIQSLREYLFVESIKGPMMTGLGKLISFSPLIFVFGISFGFNKLSAPALTIVFLLFSAVMGMSLSTVLWMYTQSSILGCFASASAMFGVMAVMGYTTDKDLTAFGSILTMGLIGIIIASMVNFLLHSTALYYIISFLGVAIFTGLTAYDVQKLKRIGSGIEYQGISAAETQKLALLGSLNLYLDFINIFLFLLNIFGDRKK